MARKTLPDYIGESGIKEFGPDYSKLGDGRVVKNSYIADAMGLKNSDSTYLASKMIGVKASDSNGYRTRGTTDKNHLIQTKMDEYLPKSEGSDDVFGKLDNIEKGVYPNLPEYEEIEYPKLNKELEYVV